MSTSSSTLESFLGSKRMLKFYWPYQSVIENKFFFHQNSGTDRVLFSCQNVFFPETDLCSSYWFCKVNTIKINPHFWKIIFRGVAETVEYQKPVAEHVTSCRIFFIYVFWSQYQNGIFKGKLFFTIRSSLSANPQT